MIYQNIKCNTHALGDTLACVAVVEMYQRFSPFETVNFSCAPWLIKYLQPVYPTINFLDEINADIYLDYLFDMPVQAGFAYQLFGNGCPKSEFKWDFIDPKIWYPEMNRPIQNKYVSFSIHSTAQIKYWNSGNRKDNRYSIRWAELCHMLRKIDVTPVMVDKEFGFGVDPNWNEPPKHAVVKVGLPFDEVLNIIAHSELYIGLSSGLSWVAKAMGKKTVMIAPWAEAINEFGPTNDNHIRVESNSQCRHCWSDSALSFDRGDWYWCPKHQGTEKEFCCSSEISAEQVLKEIFKKGWIYHI
jgi:hypothetical protein